MLSRVILAAAASTWALLASSQLQAQEVRLIFASGSPAGTPNSVFYQKWVDRVNEQGKGVLRVELRDGESIANFINVYDRVQNDVVQIGWSIHSLIGSRFPLSDVVSLPFQGDDNVACSAAFWRLYKSGVVDNEYQDIVPLWFGCLTASHLHWAKAPRSLEDLNGLKFRVNGKLPGRVIQLLGGTPVSMAGGEMYEGLQRGTIDGVSTSWPGFEPYKLHEVSFYHLEVPVGVTPSMHFMSKKKFDALPQKAREIIAANSGEGPSRDMGAYIQESGNRARAVVANSDKHQIVKLTPQQLEAWKKKTQPAVDEWAKERQGGDKAIEMFNKHYADVAAGR